MNPLSVWRSELRQLIPCGFLRRDSKPDSLFVSDYPRWPGAENVTRSLMDAGFSVTPEERAAHIDGTCSRYALLLAELPLPSVQPTDETLYACALAQRLMRGNAPFLPCHLPILRALLKATDAGELPDLRRLSGQAAEAQRLHRPLPAAAGRLLLCALALREGGASCDTPSG